MSRPLLPAFILFIAGIIFACYIPLPFPAVIGLIAFSFILLLLFRNRRNLIFYIISGGLVFLLAAAAYLNYNKLPANHISYLLKDRDWFAPSGLAMTPEDRDCFALPFGDKLSGLATTYIKGIIVSSPEYVWGRWSRRRCSFLLKASGYKRDRCWVEIDGLSKVNINDNQRQYYYGETVVISGRLKEPTPAANPGEFDYAGYLRAQKVYTLFDVKSDQDITPIKGKRPPALKRFIFNQRLHIESLIKKYLPAQDGAILNAMLIGRRGALSEDLKEQFVKTGTAHVLSISGLHVAVISAMAFFLLRLIRVPRKASAVLLMGFLIAYALLTGARAPILRAAIMIGVYLVGYILERDFDIYSALSLAGIIILAVNPMQLFDAGFVLSFACVLSIYYLTPKLESFFFLLLKERAGFKKIEKNVILRYLVGLISGSAAVYIGTAPLIGYYFNIVSPITMLANLLIIPLLGVVLFSGILFLMAAAFFSPLAAAFSYPSHLILMVFTGIIYQLSRIPLGHFYIADIPLYAVALYYILLSLAIKRKSLGLNWIKVSGIILLLINIFIWRPLFIKADQLKVTLLDLKGGHSAFVEFPGGETMLINAGRRLSHYYNQGESTVLPFIWSRGKRSIDYLYLTCLDSAHIDAALPVLKRFRVRYLISSASARREKNCQRLEEALLSKKIEDMKVNEGMRIEGVDKVHMSAIYPSGLKLTYKDVSFLLSPEKDIIQTAGGEPQAVDASGKGAITIITDGTTILMRPFRSGQRQEIKNPIFSV